MPVALVGIVQLPFVPYTANVTTSAARIGSANVPTVSGEGRVSTSRHGTIGTNADAVPPAAKLTVCTRISAVTVAAASAAVTPMGTNLN